MKPNCESSSEKWGFGHSGEWDRSAYPTRSRGRVPVGVWVFAPEHEDENRAGKIQPIIIIILTITRKQS